MSIFTPASKKGPAADFSLSHRGPFLPDAQVLGPGIKVAPGSRAVRRFAARARTAGSQLARCFVPDVADAPFIRSLRFRSIGPSQSRVASRPALGSYQWPFQHLPALLKSLAKFHPLFYSSRALPTTAITQRRVNRKVFPSLRGPAEDGYYAARAERLRLFDALTDAGTYDRRVRPAGPAHGDDPVAVGVSLRVSVIGGLDSQTTVSARASRGAADAKKRAADADASRERDAHSGHAN